MKKLLLISFMSVIFFFYTDNNIYAQQCSSLPGTHCEANPQDCQYGQWSGYSCPVENPYCCRSSSCEDNFGTCAYNYQDCQYEPLFPPTGGTYVCPVERFACCAPCVPEGENCVNAYGDLLGTCCFPYVCTGDGAPGYTTFCEVRQTPLECGVDIGDECVSEEACDVSNGTDLGIFDCDSQHPDLDYICCEYPETTPCNIAGGVCVSPETCQDHGAPLPGTHCEETSDVCCGLGADECQRVCTDPAYPVGRCTAGNPNDTLCDRPPGSNWLQDCYIDDIRWDCYCCRGVVAITERPAKSTRCNPNTGDICDQDYKDAHPNWESICTGVHSAIGCIPMDDSNDLIAFLLRWGIGIGGGITFLLIIYAGFQITTSAGDIKKFQAGKELLTAAIAGVIMLIFSVFMLELLGVRILQLPGF